MAFKYSSISSSLSAQQFMDDLQHIWVIKCSVRVKPLEALFLLQGWVTNSTRSGGLNETRNIFTCFLPMYPFYLGDCFIWAFCNPLDKVFPSAFVPHTTTRYHQQPEPLSYCWLPTSWTLSGHSPISDFNKTFLCKPKKWLCRRLRDQQLVKYSEHARLVQTCHV